MMTRLATIFGRMENPSEALLACRIRCKRCKSSLTASCSGNIVLQLSSIISRARLYISNKCLLHQSKCHCRTNALANEFHSFRYTNWPGATRCSLIFSERTGADVVCEPSPLGQTQTAPPLQANLSSASSMDPSSIR